MRQKLRISLTLYEIERKIYNILFININHDTKNLKFYEDQIKRIEEKLSFEQLSQHSNCKLGEQI